MNSPFLVRRAHALHSCTPLPWPRHLAVVVDICGTHAAASQQCASYEVRSQCAALHRRLGLQDAVVQADQLEVSHGGSLRGRPCCVFVAVQNVFERKIAALVPWADLLPSNRSAISSVIRSCFFITRLAHPPRLPDLPTKRKAALKEDAGTRIQIEHNRARAKSKAHSRVFASVSGDVRVVHSDGCNVCLRLIAHRSTTTPSSSSRRPWTRRCRRTRSCARSGAARRRSAASATRRRRAGRRCARTEKLRKL